METDACFLGGATKRAIEEVAHWLKESGFNAIRLPLAADALLNPDHPCMLEGDQTKLREHNMALGALGYLGQIGEVVRVAAESGLLVLLDMHVMRAGEWPDGGMVRPSDKPQLFAAWKQLAEAFCDPDDNWNVIGADLKNEPYAMSCAPSLRAGLVLGNPSPHPSLTPRPMLSCPHTLCATVR